VIEPIRNLFAAVKGFFSVPLIWLQQPMARV
jgi:hypothetical protein